MPIAKFARNLFFQIEPLKILFQQGSVGVGSTIELLLSRIVALEECFDSRPGDVAEQRRRDDLIMYVLVFPLDLYLSSFQQV